MTSVAAILMTTMGQLSIEISHSVRKYFPKSKPSCFFFSNKSYEFKNKFLKGILIGLLLWGVAIMIAMTVFLARTKRFNNYEY